MFSRKGLEPNDRRHVSALSRLLVLMAVVVSLAGFFALRKEPAPAVSPSSSASIRPALPYVNRAAVRLSSQLREAPSETKISGFVYDSSGGVIVGAKVAAATFEVAGNIPSAARTVETDAGGAFELRVPDGTYQIHANKRGFGPSFVLANSGETVSLVLAKSGVLRGRVMNEKGPVSRFSVEVLTAVSETSAAPAVMSSIFAENTAGVFEIDELPPWPFFVRIVAEGHAPTFSKPLRVGPEQVQDVEFMLSEGCTLEGIVKDADGMPLAGVFIDAESVMAAGQMNRVSMDADRQTTSGVDGRFHIEHVPAVPELMVRGYDGSHAASTLMLDVSSCAAAKSVELVMSEGATIAGIARAGNGLPLAGGRVTLTQRVTGFVNAITDADGRYRFESIPDGMARLELTHQGQSNSVLVRVEDGIDVERDIELAAQGTGELSGRITAGDKPIAGLRLLVAASSGPERGFDMRFPVTDALGAYRVTQLPPAHYVVKVLSSVTSAGVDITQDTPTKLDLDVSAPRRRASRTPGDEKTRH